MGEMKRELLKNYHCAVVKSNLDNLEKLKAKMGSEWASVFKEKVGEIADVEQFCKSFEKYLQDDLGLCDSVEARESGGELSIKINGCHICFGNEELRKMNLPTLCPVIPTGLLSISRVHGKKATLKGVEKTGVVGECTLHYQLQEWGIGKWNTLIPRVSFLEFARFMSGNLARSIYLRPVLG
jgi:hypothetical protein